MKNNDKYAGLSKPQRFLIKTGNICMWTLIVLETIEIALVDHVPGWKAVILAVLAIGIAADIRWMNSLFRKKETPVQATIPSFQADIDAVNREAETGEGSLKDLFD